MVDFDSHEQLIFEIEYLIYLELTGTKMGINSLARHRQRLRMASPQKKCCFSYFAISKALQF